MKRAAIISMLVLAAGGVLMVLAMQGAPMPVLEPAGPIALAQMRVIVVSVLLMLLIVVPVFFLLFFFAWKYRDESPEAHVHHHPSWDHDSAAAEFLWWLVPSAIIAVLAIIAWQSSHALDPYVPLKSSEPTLTVQVVALNWKWLFIYPEQGIASLNELTIPEATPVHFLLTADAPMNSFWVPSLGGMIMVMPGMQTQLHLAADNVGTYDGFSGNLSGKGFSGMTFKVRSVSRQDFDSWVQATRLSPHSLNTQSYAALMRDSENDPVVYYSAVEPSLYTSIYMKFMPQSQTHNPHTSI